MLFVLHDSFPPGHSVLLEVDVSPPQTLTGWWDWKRHRGGSSNGSVCGGDTEGVVAIAVIGEDTEGVV